VTATVHLPVSLARLFPGCSRAEPVSPGTLGDVLRELDSRWPGMWDRLCESSHELRRHIIVLDDDGKRMDLRAPVLEGAEVHVLLAMSGG